MLQPIELPVITFLNVSQFDRGVGRELALADPHDGQARGETRVLNKSGYLARHHLDPRRGVRGVKRRDQLDRDVPPYLRESTAGLPRS